MRRPSIHRAALPHALAAVIAALAASGCYAPLSGSAPLGPTSQGHKEYGLALAIEYPVLDMLNTATAPPDASMPDTYPRTGMAFFNLRGGLGVSPTVDLEAGLQGAVYVLMPIPHGGWLGFRHHVYSGKHIDLGYNIRAGYSGLAAARAQEPFKGSSVRIAFAQVTTSTQLKFWKHLRPSLAVTAQPMWVETKLMGAGDEPGEDLYGFTASATVGMDTPWITPFVTGGVLLSTNVRGTAPYVSGGLARRF